MQDLSNENVIHKKSGEIEYLQFKLYDDNMYDYA